MGAHARALPRTASIVEHGRQPTLTPRKRWSRPQLLHACALVATRTTGLKLYFLLFALAPHTPFTTPTATSLNQHMLGMPRITRAARVW